MDAQGRQVKLTISLYKVETWIIARAFLYYNSFFCFHLKVFYILNIFAGQSEIIQSTPMINMEKNDCIIYSLLILLLENTLKYH